MSSEGIHKSMHRHPLFLACLIAFAASLFSPLHDAHPAPSGEPAQGEQSGQVMEMDPHDHADGTIEAMTPHQQHTGPHMRWTALRPANAQDSQRADQIVRALRDSLAKYKDYQVAVNDGYIPHHPERRQRHYHFANKQHRFMARVHFDPAEPTALLYTKTANGYELEGAMYTAPRHMNEDQLNERIPLSVAQWHAHVNLCFSPDGSRRRMTRREFGFKGTIATESECQRAGGQFVPQAGGWMIHVYPFKATTAEIWTH